MCSMECPYETAQYIVSYYNLHFVSKGKKRYWDTLSWICLSTTRFGHCDAVAILVLISLPGMVYLDPYYVQIHRSTLPLQYIGFADIDPLNIFNFPTTKDGFIVRVLRTIAFEVLKDLEVIPFIDKLRRHFPLKSVEVDVGATQVGDVDVKHSKAAAECGLPFEFQVLELALEAVCLSFHSSLSDLNKQAIFVLDELTKNASNRNLERVRILKRHLTSLLAGVLKVRDEVEHLLDHNENLGQLHLSRKQIKSPQDEALLVSSDLHCNFPSEINVDIRNSFINQAASIAVVAPLDDHVGDLEMLLESYFMQLDGIRNRIMMVRGYIVDTEDYINIQLDNQRNGLIQLHLILIIVSFGISINTFIAASFAMNMPRNGDYKKFVGRFCPFVGTTSSFCLLVIVVLLGYAWRNRLLAGFGQR